MKGERIEAAEEVEYLLCKRTNFSFDWDLFTSKLNLSLAFETKVTHKKWIEHLKWNLEIFEEMMNFFFQIYHKK